MDLLSMLMGSMTHDSSVEALTKKSGGSSKAIKTMLLLAIPLIIRYMTKNAKESQQGATSLLGALQQHTSTQSMASQISNADAQDGAAILGHVFGNDYDTLDGTGVRDFIHVVDLARGHVAALSAVSAGCGVKTYNLGTGRGYSVLELIRAFERVNGVRVTYVVDGRRAGDLGSVWSDPSKAWRELGWKAEKGIDEMCRDAWGWEKERLL